MAHSTMTTPQKHGVLLLNLGTPDSTDPKDVGRYLKQFLMDPLVVDIPAVFRWILVNWMIVPRRSHLSAEAYAKIWGEKGSPLLVHTQDLTRKVQAELGADFQVEFGMRYGNPSISSAIQKFDPKNLKSFQVLPLFPQYSEAATESALKEMRMGTASWTHTPAEIRDFFAEPMFIEPLSQKLKEHLSQKKYDFLLFSYHGLPERHLKKLDATGSYCLNQKDCCSQISSSNQSCYRAQCYATTRAVAARLGLKKDFYETTFQSRLGRTPWIQPFTDQFYRDLPSRGIKNIAVICPSFVSDCLETLEEVAMRGRDEFIQNGGESLDLIPCLNSDLNWAQSLAARFRSNLA